MEQAGTLSRPTSLSVQAALYVAGTTCAAWCLYAAQAGGSARSAVTAGLTGFLAALILKRFFTRKPLTLREALQDALILAALAASADPGVRVWQPPGGWTDLFSLTGGTSCACCAFYLAALGVVLAARGRHLSLAAGLCMSAVPYLFNLLLLLQAPGLLRELGASLPLASGLSPRVQELAGRAMTLLVFNQAVAGTVHLLFTGRWTREVRLHLLLAGSALFTVITPVVADWGSNPALALWPRVPAVLAAVGTAVVSQAGLWAQTYLLTGILLHALRNRKPGTYWAMQDYTAGLAKGAVYSGVFLGLLHGIALVALNPAAAGFVAGHAVLASLVFGALAFPLFRTIVESFDDSERFPARLRRNFLDPSLYVRGAVVGFGFGVGFLAGMPAGAGGVRFLFGFAVGGAGYALVDLARDTTDVVRDRRAKLQSWRVYFLGALLGGFVGGALAWYLDQLQVEVILQKFRQYTAICYTGIGKAPEAYGIYPLFSKWGAMDLGRVQGGTRLFYSEALCGVINWSIAAPLFSVNLVLLTALFQRSVAPIRRLFSREGGVELVEQAIRVQRWGLWMAPVIFSFLRMSPTPTWYNQDGAVRTLAAAAKSATLGPDGFRSWSLNLFTRMLAFDWLRILIWVDHMGLRVSTLVNLSFIGGDWLDEKAASFVGYNARTHCLPEGVRRFATWAPLLIPFYLPRGGDWDRAWKQAEAMARAAGPGIVAPATALLFGFVMAAVGVGAVLAFRQLGGRRRHLPVRASQAESPEAWSPGGAGLEKVFLLGNGVYTLELMGDGRGYSRVFRSAVKGEEIDLTRRAEDPMQLFGRAYYLVDRERPAQDPGRAWSLMFQPLPREGAEYRVEEPRRGSLRFRTTFGGIRAETEVRVADHESVEVWRVRLTNLESRPRDLELTSYREFALNGAGFASRNPFFNRMHVGTWFVRPLNAVLAGNRLLKDAHRDAARRRMSSETAFHAVKETADGSVRLLGYEDSRSRFIGTETLRRPAALDRALRGPEDEGLLHTFDPVAGLKVGVRIGPWGTAEVRFLDGFAGGPLEAARRIERHLGVPRTDGQALQSALERRRVLNGFDGPAEEGTRKAETAGNPGDAPQELFRFSEDGTELHLGWETPRPWAHQMANELGYGLVLTNDGNLFSFMRNSQQNALTPPHMDSMPAQVPGQVLYLVNLETGQSSSPTYIPFREKEARHEIVYGRGYAVYRKTLAGIQTEMTVFVPPDEPLEVRILKIGNLNPEPVSFRVVPYFQMILAEVASDSRWGMEARFDPETGALFFCNPRNRYHRGWAFAATSLPVREIETVRSRFLGGPGRDLASPYLVEHGRPDAGRPDDGFRIASLVSTLTVPPGAEVSASFILGQAADREAAGEFIRAYQDVDRARQALERTRRWWAQTLSVLRIETDQPAFDRLVNDWLPYQTMVARLWGRCGRMQRSGGYGFRDQLQDVMPFFALGPDLARRQILEHGGRQFVEGDVLQWWHETWDGKTGLGARNRASDPPLWLPYLVHHYVRATGDRTVLDEPVPFLEGKSIPRGAEGVLVIPRSSREVEPLFGHCLRSIDLTLKRMGRNGLPLIGTGDWNDGLSAVGCRGKGESVWLGFFLYEVLTHFADLAEEKGIPGQSDRFREKAERLREALDAMWRGDRYVRAITDDGIEMRFADALTAAWPVISGAADFERGARAMEKALQDLEKDRRVLLLDPPFTERSPIFPGKLADYPPGVRENGGQYSHGASWLVDALVRLAELAAEAGRHDRAGRFRERALEVWLKISPVTHAAPDTVHTFGLPPHQQPADVYHGFGYEGRGGWSWYTGAAARMITAAHGILGLKMRDGRLEVPDSFWQPKGTMTPRRLLYKGREYLAPVPDAAAEGIAEDVDAVTQG
jgi:cyclic beta-1,2-glucan synthetase